MLLRMAGFGMCAHSRLDPSGQVALLAEVEVDVRVKGEVSVGRGPGGPGGALNVNQVSLVEFVGRGHGSPGELGAQDVRGRPRHDASGDVRAADLEVEGR